VAGLEPATRGSKTEVSLIYGTYHFLPEKEIFFSVPFAL